VFGRSLEVSCPAAIIGASSALGVKCVDCFPSVTYWAVEVNAGLATAGSLDTDALSTVPSSISASVWDCIFP
jgi:hypothetical protein